MLFSIWFEYPFFAGWAQMAIIRDHLTIMYGLFLHTNVFQYKGKFYKGLIQQLRGQNFDKF